MAASQHAVLSLGDLEDCGLSRDAVQYRARAGKLHRVYRGVYSLVPLGALTVSGRRLAAVLACGPGAGLACRSAGDQRGLRRTIRAGIDVVIPHGRRVAEHAGIDLHRSRTLTAADITPVDGIPTTTVARTLLDLAAIVRAEELERALNQAEALHQFDRRALDDELARNPHHPGARALKAALELYRIDGAPTESAHEAAFLTLVRRAGLPEPKRQLHLDLGPGGPQIRADFAWPTQHVIVEIDTVDFHGTRATFESDRHRDALLQAGGWRVLRFTDRQLRTDAAGVIRILTQVLMAAQRAA